MGDSMIYMIANIALVAASLTGAIMMWKLKKVGFYTYAFANIVAFVLPFIMVEGYQLNIIALVIVLGFIAMYGANVKHMK